MPTSAIAPEMLQAAQQIMLAHLAQTSTKGVVSTTPRSSGYAHGSGGLLSAPGMTRELINAMMLPHVGIQRLIPSRASNEQFPVYGIITGQTASSGVFTGANTAGVCDDPPAAGLLKLCGQSYSFGRQSMQTPVFELDRIGMVTNRGESLDYRLIGGPTDDMVPGAPTIPGDSGMAGALRSETGKAMFELATAWLRDYSRFFYTGNRTNNTGGGIIKEYNGLQGLIQTGYRDYETGQACARADSFIRTFASRNVRTSPAAADGIVATITGIMRQLRFRAIEMGLMPVDWRLAMRWSAFYELTEVWPCAYNTYRCVAADSGLSVSQPAVNEAIKLQEQRNEMRGDWDARTGQFLWIDGIKVPVEIDDAIPETALANGAFNSDIYFVPLTVLGGFQSLYMEHVNYDMPNGAMDAARILAPDAYFTTDGGRFLWHKKPPANYCVQAVVKTEPRLILRTPQIAARLTNVGYSPWQHEDEAYVTPGYYFTNGGKTNRDGYGPSWWSPNTNVG